METINQYRSSRPVGASPVHPALRSSVQCIRRFDGHQKTAATWDSLRRDEELWYNDGDCVVNFYNYGSSRRGPSLRVYVADLEKSKSPYLLTQCLLRCEKSGSLTGEESGPESGHSTTTESTGAFDQLFVPAPTDLSREDTHVYHIGTRNYFAFLLGKPLVGERLGTALTDLWGRIQLWQPHNANPADLLSYCEEQGYYGFANNPTHALAVLQLSEELGASDLWMDAFAHCVGMRSRLDSCTEKRELSNTTYALITRASLEMGLHVDRITAALREFLEEALGPENFGLSKSARDHLDRFRSCLQSFYVEKLGYYPPDVDDCWSKETWSGMYDDFETLYEYLADPESSHDLSSSHGVSGGTCVLQNVQAFNERHGFAPLPYALPLSPTLPANHRTTDSQINLKSFKRGRTESHAEISAENESPLEQASNSDQAGILDNPLVQEYVQFERQKLEEKITVLEARKVRWMLVYGMLQMLISITHAPKEVSNVALSTYPLCLPGGCEPSLRKLQAQQNRHRQERLSAETWSLRPSMDEDRISIHPDCEASSAEEFFSRTGRSRTDSDKNDYMTPAPLRAAPAFSRTASIRSSVHSSVNSLQRSVMGSLSRRNSTRRTSLLHSLSRVSSSIMPVPEMDDAEDEADRRDPKRFSWIMTGIVDAPLRPASAHSSYDSSGEPTLEDHQLRLVADECPASPVESYVSAISRQDDQHSCHSSVLDFCDSPVSEPSSVDDDLDSSPLTPPRMADPSLAGFDFSLHDLMISSPYDSSHDRQDSVLYKSATNVNAGCYMPSGAAATIPSRVSSLRAFQKPANSLLAVPPVVRSESFSSVVSDASSMYPETSQQAAEIEEEETRGRRRMRGLERLPMGFGKVDARFFEGITELR